MCLPRRFFQVIEFDDGSGSVLRIQPLRTHRDEAIYECTATNSAGEINTSAKLTVLEGKIRLFLFRSTSSFRCLSLLLPSLPLSPLLFVSLMPVYPKANMNVCLNNSYINICKLLRIQGVGGVAEEQMDI